MPRFKHKILFVISELVYGGIETLALRMANWLSLQGYSVHILSKGPGDLDKYLERGVLLKYFSDFKIYSPNISKDSYDLMVDFCMADTIHSFSFESNAISQQIIRYLVNNNIEKPGYVFGVYHPKSCIFKNFFIEYFLVYPFINKLQSENLIFMSEEVKNSHEAYFNVDFSLSFIIPLPITKKKAIILNKFQKIRKIISIGRIDYFKTYNFYMPNIVENLANIFPDLEYHIYGYGPAEGELCTLLTTHNLKKTFFHGKLDYFKMSHVLKDAFCFIGMGTSAVEASAFGIPTIVAIVEEYNKTHGFLYDLPLGNVGEKTNLPIYKISDLMLKLLKEDISSYIIKSNECLSSAKKYDIDEIMNLYLNIINNKKIKNYKLINKFDLLKMNLYLTLKNIIKMFPNTHTKFKTSLRKKKYSQKLNSRS